MSFPNCIRTIHTVQLLPIQTINYWTRSLGKILFSDELSIVISDELAGQLPMPKAEVNHDIFCDNRFQ
jgi:hypothetical protein